jgi:hyperosmotically inducible protein
MQARESITVILATAALAIGLAGCQKKDDTTGKGPAEKAGEQVDRAASQAGENLNKAREQTGQAIEKAGEKTGEAAQSAGEKLKNAGQDAQKPPEEQKK